MRLPIVSTRRPLAFSLSRFTSAAAVCAAMAMASSASGASLEWDTDPATAGAAGGDGLWNTANNLWWNGTSNVSWNNAALDTAVFSGVAPVAGFPQTVSLGAPITVGGLTFSQDLYSIAGGPDPFAPDPLNVLTLGGATPTVTVTTAGHLASISAPLAGTGGLTKAGAGTLSLTGGANTFSGAVSVTNGTLSFTNNNQLGAGDLVNLSNGGTLSYQSGGEWGVGVSRAFNIGTGGGTIDSTAAFRLFNDNQLTGSGTLTRTGGGTNYALDIRGNNSGFTGNVVINSSTIEIQNPLALGNGSNPDQTITVNGDPSIGGITGILSTSSSVPQKVILNGGTLSFNNNSTSSYTGPVVVQSNSRVELKDFYANNGRSGKITGPLTGTGTLSINSSSGSLQALTLAGGSTGFTGKFEVNDNAVLVGSVGVAGGATTFGNSDVNFSGFNGGTLRITPNIGSEPLLGQTAGLVGRYYNQTGASHGNNSHGVNYTAPDATRIDDDLNLRFLYATGNRGTSEGVPSNIGTVNGGNIENFGAMWNGLLNITTGGQYTFVSSSDDGSSVFIDGVQIITNEGGHDFPGGGNRSGTVTLAPGHHSITVRLAQGGGGAGVVLGYEGPDQPIPLQNPFPKDGYNTSTLIPSSAFTNATIAGSISNKITIPDFSVGGVEAAGLDLTSTGIITVGDGGTIKFGSSTGNTVKQSGNVALLGGGVISTQLTTAGTAANVEISGVISGTNGFTKSGLGTLTLTGANTFTGTVDVEAGTLAGNTDSLKTNINLGANLGNATRLVFNQAAAGTYTGLISEPLGFGTSSVIKNGAGKLTFTQTVGAPLIVNAGDATLSAGAAAGVTVNGGASLTPIGTITGSLALNSGSAVNLSIPALPSGTAVVNVGDAFAGTTLTVNGPSTVNLNAAGAVGAGTYRLIDYAGDALTAPQFSDLALGTAPTGSFYSLLINNTTNTSVDYLVENFGALNTWTGTTNGTWDTTTATNWTSGAFANGQQVTFNDTGANKTVTGGAVAPQRIVISNTTGNDYSIANSVTGLVAGGIEKSGTGKATLSGDVSVAGPVKVTGGTLALTNTSLTTPNQMSGVVTVDAGGRLEAAFGGARPLVPGESGTSALGGAPINLNGGEVVFTGKAYDDGTGGLTGQYYDQQVQRNARVEMASLSSITALFNTSTPETIGGTGVNAGFTNAISTVDFANGYGNNAAFAGVGLTQVDNIMATWKGKVSVEADGDYTFLGRSDDGLMVFIDGQLVVNRNNFQGNSLTSGTINLTAGDHDIYVSYYEGGGGSGVQLFRDFDGNVLPLSDLTAAQPVTDLGNNVTLSASSTLRASNTYGVNLGRLSANVPGVTLTTGSTTSLDGLTRFSNTAFGANGTYTFKTHSDVALGTLSDGTNGNVIISKTGTGNLILDSTGALADADGTTIRVEEGRLVAQRTNTGNNPLGAANIELNGVDSVVQFSLIESNAGNGTFENAIVVNENAQIEFTNHSRSGREIILGNAGNGISIATGKTLSLVATSAANPRINGVISGDADVRVHVGADAGNSQGFFLFNAANTFTGKLTIESGGNVRLDNANAITSADHVDLRGNGRIEFYANNSFSENTPRILSQNGSYFRVNTLSNPSQVIGSGTLEIGTGRILEFQGGNPFTGAGTVTRAPGSYLQMNTGNQFLAGTTQVGMRASDVRPLDVIRTATTVTGRGDGVVNEGWGATAPGTIIQITGGDRNISNTNIQELNGQIITQDGAFRRIQDGNRLDVGSLGGTIASSNGQALVVQENLLMDAASGKLTIGAHIPLDNRFSNGTVVFGHGNAGDFTGTTASAAKAIDVIGGSMLEGYADTDGDTGYGSAATPTLGVNLARGILRSQQPTANSTTAGTYSVSVGKVFVTGAGTINVNRNTGNTGVVTEMRLASSIDRSAGATLGLQSQNNDLGGSERIRFNNNADAPARLTSGATTVNMVAPHFLNVAGNVGSFVDYDPTQDSATGPGFVNAAYTTAFDETAFTAGSIVDTTGAITLTADATVAAARLQGGLSGAFTLTSESGGFILTTATNVNQTITANIAAPAGKEMIFYSGGATGGFHNLNGKITSDSGFTKFGPRTLQLNGDNSTTLFGDITINEASLVVGADNRLGAPGNRVVLNGGNLRPNANMTLGREIVVNVGGGQLANDGNRTIEYSGVISGPGGLSITSVNGNNGVNRLTAANTFEGGLIISNGIVEFSNDNQLGALPAAGDYDRGHVVINEAGGSNATLRLAVGAGAVSTGDRQFSLLGGNARIEVAGADDTLTIANDIRGTSGGGINKNGPGTLILSNPDGNGYTGNTLVNAGALLVNNTTFSGTGTGAVTVNDGATLGGSGIIEGSITGNFGAILSPGASLAAGTVGELRGQNGLTLNDESGFRWSLSLESTASPGTNFDRFTLDNGLLSVADGANLLFDFAPGAAPSGDAFWASNQTWSNVIQITSLGTIGTLGAFDIDNSAWSEFGSFSAVADADGYDVRWTTAVPEPGTGMALFMGASSLLGMRRFRRRSGR